MEHDLKIESYYFDQVIRGIKKFELRKNDRDFEIGDIITLREVDIVGRETGEKRTVQIQYVFYGGQYGLSEDYCIFNW